jgi:acetoin utilization deacetylase AcuC-like enzyme
MKEWAQSKTSPAAFRILERSKWCNIAPMKTGFVWDERFAWFYTGFDRRPSPFYQPMPALDSRGYDIVRLSAGACAVGVEGVLDGVIDNAYVLARPAGHHATSNMGRGFCILSNIPIAILRAQSGGKVRRVAVVDWDVHHGNGTQDAFYRDPNVLTISIHQAGNYPPGSGTLEENGEGPGAGFNINLPLPPGSGHGAYLDAMNRVVIPALDRFRPELIIIASGLDANTMDPLARMMCYSETYREMTRLIRQAAGHLCNGRLVLCHEGGYSAVYVPWCALAIIEELSGIRTNFTDPSRDRFAAWPYQELQPHQAEIVARAAALISHIRPITSESKRS